MGTEKDWADMSNDFFTNKKKAAANPYEQAIKDYLGQTQHLYNQLQANKAQAAQLYGGVSNRDKYGRILYKYDGAGTLQIINKYGDPRDPTIGEDYTLYSGPLL